MNTLEQLKSGQIKAEHLGSEKRLQLAENLTEFPREVFDLADSLEILDLSNNRLDSLPDDLGRLHQLRILFLSNNQFDHLPTVLADCPKLEMIGFKANKITLVAEDALPVDTRWLILTDNKIEKLPNSMGKLHRLQKLALAGNQLTALPASMANCKNLELVRLSANQLTSMPDWLFQLPKLAWLAFAGNAFNSRQKDAINKDMLAVNMLDIELAEQLGEGASGVIYKGEWINHPASLIGSDSSIAVKLFKGEVTSDGYPQDELNCCLTAGEHPNLIKVVAQISQNDQLGLVMELIPTSFYNLGLPPSLVTCTRDTFVTGTQFTLQQIIIITLNMARAMAHLHGNGVSHGDVYAHNTMIDEQSSVLFGDFGAATDLASLPTVQKEAMESIEVRAFGCLLEDLLELSSLENTSEQDGKLNASLKELKNSCMQNATALRPSFNEVKQQLLMLLTQSEAELAN